MLLLEQRRSLSRPSPACGCSEMSSMSARAACAEDYILGHRAFTTPNDSTGQITHHSSEIPLTRLKTNCRPAPLSQVSFAASCQIDLRKSVPINGPLHCTNGSFISVTGWRETYKTCQSSPLTCRKRPLAPHLSLSMENH